MADSPKECNCWGDKFYTYLERFNSGENTKIFTTISRITFTRFQLAPLIFALAFKQQYKSIFKRELAFFVRGCKTLRYKTQLFYFHSESLPLVMKYFVEFLMGC